MDDDNKGDTRKTESVRLLLVHDSGSRAKNLAESGETATLLEDAGNSTEVIERKAQELMGGGLQARRFPARIPTTATSDAHWTARYEGETVPIPRTHTPPAQSATIIDMTDPGRRIDLVPRDTAPSPSRATPTMSGPPSTSDEDDFRRVPTLRLARDPKREANTVPDAPSLRRRGAAVLIGVVAVLLLALAAKLLVASKHRTVTPDAPTAAPIATTAIEPPRQETSPIPSAPPPSPTAAPPTGSVRRVAPKAPPRIGLPAPQHASAKGPAEPPVEPPSPLPERDLQ